MDRFSVDKIPVDPAQVTPTIKQIVSHASVRRFDTGKPLPEGLLTTLLAAGQSASTSSNFQLWSVVAVSDPERKRTLSHLANNQAFIDQAPLFLVFCADLYRSKWLTQRQGYSFDPENFDLTLSAFVDAGLACQNVALAAESLGLGICYVGGVRDSLREISEVLGLPEGVCPAFGLCVGRPARGSEVKPRLPQSVVLHKERYSLENLETGAEDYDVRMAETGIYGNRRVQVPGVTPEPDRDTGHYGWLEHTARRMASAKGARRGNARFLKERGFYLD